MKFVKPIIGVLIVVLSLAGLIYWENAGREKFLMEEVAVAASDIEIGTVIDSSMFKRAHVSKDNLITGALRYKEMGKIAGKISDRPIAANSQVAVRFFDEVGSRLANGKSIFVIKPTWIDMRSSSVRAGDVVRIYDSTGNIHFGDFVLAFVKDDNEQEVVAADGISRQENVLDRKMSSRAANHLEIIATLEEYKAIMGYATQEGCSLMIVQKGDF